MHDAEEVLDAIVEAARETWEAAVANRGKGAEWTPKFLLYDDSGAVDLVVPIVALAPGEVVSTAEIIMEAAPEVVRPTTAWLAVTVDAYASTDEALNMLCSVGTTSLSAEYKRGNPLVLDTLFVHAVDRSGHQHHRELPYRVRGKWVEWLTLGRAIPMGAQMSGRMADALVAAMTRAGN